MSLFRTALVATLLMASAASPVAAQQFVIPQSSAGPMSQIDLWNRQLTAIAGARATKTQWKRAVRAAALINANRCKDAYLLAANEQDERLAKRVYEVCTAPA